MSDDNWLLQVSLKTPAGALINARGFDRDALQVSLASIAELLPQILELEQSLTAGGHVAAALPLAPQQPAQPAPQQAGPPAGLGWQPAAPQQQQWGPPQQPAQPAAPQQWSQPAQQRPAQPQQQGGAVSVPNCNHGVPCKWVPPGISTNTQRPYKGFFACSFGRQDDCGFKA